MNPTFKICSVIKTVVIATSVVVLTKVLFGATENIADRSTYCYCPKADVCRNDKPMPTYREAHDIDPVCPVNKPSLSEMKKSKAFKENKYAFKPNKSARNQLVKEAIINNYRY